MSEYQAEDYDNVAADPSADAELEIQDEAESYEEDSDSLDNDSSTESNVQDSGDRQVTDRELYARYGEMNSRVQDMSGEVADMKTLIAQQNQMLQMNQANQQQVSADKSIYKDMDATQREAADKLVSEHPIVQGLLQERQQRHMQEQQYNNQVQEQSEHQLKTNHQEFYQLMGGIEKKFGTEVAADMSSDLEDTAQLVGWDLKHPSFQKRLDRQVKKLSGLDKDKRQTRQRASHERSGTRSGAKGPKTALRKGKNGQVYYSWDAAAENALEDIRK
mgnify:FL=1